MLLQRGLCRQKAVVAVARELCGFIWALMREMPRPIDPTPNQTYLNSMGTTVAQTSPLEGNSDLPSSTQKLRHKPKSKTKR
jgi:hypothetical protein